MDTTDRSWRESRDEALAAQAAALARQKAAETRRARQLLEEFVRELACRQIPPTRLRAHVAGHRRGYRTGVDGWYLRRNGSLGVGTDGSFYVLSTPPSLLARLRGVTLTPTDPPLTVGRGGRDGESIPLEDLLTLRLTELSTKDPADG